MLKACGARPAEQALRIQIDEAERAAKSKLRKRTDRAEEVKMNH